MLKKCNSDEESSFSALSPEERKELYLKLKSAEKIIKDNSSAFYKHREMKHVGIKPPEEGDDFEKVQIVNSAYRVFKGVINKELAFVRKHYIAEKKSREALELKVAEQNIQKKELALIKQQLLEDNRRLKEAIKIVTDSTTAGVSAASSQSDSPTTASSSRSSRSYSTVPTASQTDWDNDT